MMQDDRDAAEPPVLDLSFEAPAGVVAQVSPCVRRLVAPNAGPFTFTGTCTYIVGRGSVAIVDPGPDDPAHIAAVLAAVRGETVSHVVVTHTHRDHAPAARHVAARTEALVVGCGPHRAARPLAPGERNPLDASADLDYRPDLEMREGDFVMGPGWTLAAIETPGHTANHLAFELPEERALFSGDHVMAWSTSIVSPPDGAMADYMASLDKLKARDDAVYWPGHGGPVTDPQRLVRALHHHRRQRETSILNAVASGLERIPQIVAKVYEGLDPRLVGAASLSTFAHLEDLAARGLVETDRPAAFTGRYGKARTG